MKQCGTPCAHMASVPAAFRHSWVIISKSLLFRATTSQNPIHKFLKYHYKNSLILFIYFPFCLQCSDTNLMPLIQSFISNDHLKSVLNVQVVRRALYFIFIALRLLDHPAARGEKDNDRIVFYFYCLVERQASPSITVTMSSCILQLFKFEFMFLKQGVLSGAGSVLETAATLSSSLEAPCLVHSKLSFAFFRAVSQRVGCTVSN